MSFKSTFKLGRPTHGYILYKNDLYSSHAPQACLVENLVVGHDETEVFEVGVACNVGGKVKGITNIGGTLTTDFTKIGCPKDFILVVDEHVLTGCYFAQNDSCSGRFVATHFHSLPRHPLPLDMESLQKAVGVSMGVPEDFLKQAPYLANKAFDGNVFDTYRYELEYQSSFIGSDNKIYVQHAVLRPKSVIEMDTVKELREKVLNTNNDQFVKKTIEVDNDPRFKRVADSWAKHVDHVNGRFPMVAAVIHLKEDSGIPGWRGPGWYFGDETGGLHGPFGIKEDAIEIQKNYDPNTCGYKEERMNEEAKLITKDQAPWLQDTELVALKERIRIGKDHGGKNILTSIKEAEAFLSLRVQVCRLAALLNLDLPKDVDPIVAIEAEINRLLDIQKLWSEACNVARSHCPVNEGLSHIRDGIPKLRKERDDLRREFRGYVIDDANEHSRNLTEEEADRYINNLIENNRMIVKQEQLIDDACKAQELFELDELQTALGIAHAAMERHDRGTVQDGPAVCNAYFDAEREIVAKALGLPEERMLVKQASKSTDGPGPEGSYCQPSPYTHSVAWYTTEVEYQTKIIKDAREVLVTRGKLDGDPSMIPRHIEEVFDMWAEEIENVKKMKVVLVRERDELQREVDELRERLQFDPGGSDKIDELEMAMAFTKHGLEVEKRQHQRVKELYESAKALNRESLLDRVNRHILGPITTADPTHHSRSEIDIKDMRGFLLEFLENDYTTRHSTLSFECGALAALDWIQEIDSVYSQIIEKDREGYE